MKVTKEMMISEVVEKYPDSAIVFLEHGLHCIGCSASPFESVESGMMGHGRSEEDLNALLKDLNDYADITDKEN